MKFAELHTNIKIRIAAGFLQKLSQTLAFQFMAVYFADHFGLPAAGAIMLVSVLLSFLAGLYGGYYADTKGRRPVLVKSEFARLATLLLLTLVNSPWLFLPVVTAGLFIANSLLVGFASPATEAMVVDVSSPASRKFVYGFNYWASNVAFAAGSMIGAFLYHDYLFLLMVMTAASSIVTVILYVAFVKETLVLGPVLEKARFSVLKILAGYRTVVQDRLFLRYMLVGILMVSFEFQLSYYISVRLSREFGDQWLLPFRAFGVRVDGVKMVGILRLINTVLVVVLATSVQRISSSASDRKVLFLGCLLLTLGYAVVAVSNVGWVLMVASVVLTLGELLYVPVHQSILATLVKDKPVGKYMALSTLRLRGGNLVGSLGALVGALAPSWSMALLFLLVGLVCFLLYMTVLRRLENLTEE